MSHAAVAELRYVGRPQPGRPLPLARCKFCGAGAALSAEVGMPGGALVWSAHCLNKRCGARGPVARTPRGARQRWNDSAQQRSTRAQFRAYERAKARGEVEFP